MNEFVYDMKNIKIQRKFPQTWSGRMFGFSNQPVDVIFEIGRYSELLYRSLLMIKKHYRDFFNKNNTTTIEEYISLFNNLYKQIFDILIDQKSNLFKKFEMNYIKYNWDIFGRFFAVKKSSLYNHKILKKDSKNKTTGFVNEAYKELNPLVKKMFMLEKLCSFTTRKIWQQEITKPKNFDPNKKFKVLVRAILPKTWRLKESDKNYENQRAYFSASLIDENNKKCVFRSNLNDNYALLLIKFDNKKLLCASNKDSYSEEEIDAYNPYMLTEYTDVFLMKDEVIKGKRHKLFANAVETATPLGLLEETELYNEVNVKNPEIFGVIAPNESSLPFAKEQAKKLGVKLYTPDELNNEWCEKCS